MRRRAPAHSGPKRRLRTVADLVPSFHPRLPTARRLLPYLDRIDAGRQYTNWGPLACELERRLCEQFGLRGGSVISAASGTAALVGAMLATAGRAGSRRPLAIVPAFTFVATAIAVEQCGYTPYPVDVDAESWLLNPTRLTQKSLLGKAGLVVPVATFGRPLTQGPWIEFRSRTGIPVVIDGAATFEALSRRSTGLVGDIPVALSFHATKSFGTGEGGCVATTDEQLAMRVTRALNFGFYGSRSSRSASTNGKMSEYHAAVGLAEIDGWLRKRRALQNVADQYRRQMALASLEDRLLAGPEVASCYALFICRSGLEASNVQESLRNANIEFRLWYGEGLLKEPYFRDLPHGEIATTAAIAPRVIGLPVATDLTGSTVRRIVSAVRKGVSRGT